MLVCRKPDRAGGSDDLSGFMGLLLFLTVLIPSFAFSQTTSEKENQFVKLVELGEKGPAHALLSDLLQEDSTGIYMFCRSAEKLILPGDDQSPPPSTSDILKLYQVYQMGILYDPAGPSAWHVRQALLAIRYPKNFPNRLGRLLQNAVTSAPYKCPLFLYERWADWEIKTWKSGSNESPIGRGSILAAWQSISNLLQARQTWTASDQEESGRLQQRLALKMRAALPDCAELAKKPTQLNDPKACSDFLILYDLQNCELDDAAWNHVYGCATSHAEEAWMLRLAAIRNMGKQDYRTALQYWSRAESLETHPYHKASDILMVADLHARLGEYALARKRMLTFVAHQPGWGKPYFQLCDLILEAPKTCNFSSFDRKALYWVVIDLCQTAQNQDPRCQAEASERIYRYKKLAPSAKEIAFKGLKAGDTWPLGCWVSTVTTVKVY